LGSEVISDHMPKQPEDGPPYKRAVLLIVIVSAVIADCTMLAIGALWLIQYLH
jgi:hypothetical protein